MYWYKFRADKKFQKTDFGIDFFKPRDNTVDTHGDIKFTKSVKTKLF